MDTPPRQLDLSKLVCPMPFIKTKIALLSMARGACLRVTVQPSESQTLLASLEELGVQRLPSSVLDQELYRLDLVKL